MEVNFDAEELCIQSNNMSISIMKASLHNAGQNLSFEFNLPMMHLNIKYQYLKKYLHLEKI